MDHKIQNVEKGLMHLYQIPSEIITEEMCRHALKHRISDFIYVPHKFQTTEMCMEVVKKCGELLQYVLPNLQTYEMCLIATENNPKALEFVKPELQTKEMCLNVVKRNIWMTGAVKLEFRTDEFYIEAMKYSTSVIDFVDREPDKNRARELYLKLLRINGMALIHIFCLQQTEEICLEAVKSDPSAIQYAYAQNEEICSIATKLGICGLCYIHANLRTKKVIDAALSRDSVDDFETNDVWFKNACIKEMEYYAKLKPIQNIDRYLKDRRWAISTARITFSPMADFDDP